MSFQRGKKHKETPERKTQMSKITLKKLMPQIWSWSSVGKMVASSWKWESNGRQQVSYCTHGLFCQNCWNSLEKKIVAVAPAVFPGPFVADVVERLKEESYRQRVGRILPSFKVMSCTRRSTNFFIFIFFFSGFTHFSGFSCLQMFLQTLLKQIENQILTYQTSHETERRAGKLGER